MYILSQHDSCNYHCHNNVSPRTLNPQHLIWSLLPHFNVPQNNKFYFISHSQSSICSICITVISAFSVAKKSTFWECEIFSAITQWSAIEHLQQQKNETWIFFFFFFNWLTKLKLFQFNSVLALSIWKDFFFFHVQILFRWCWWILFGMIGYEKFYLNVKI